jgi:glyoxylase-like metal-dependent hydrolase (beta-lactamase superfamily II)
LSVPDGTIQVVPGLHLLPGQRDGRFPFSHSVLLSGGRTTLIDAGCGQDLLADARVRLQPEVVIASHSHVDHISGLWQFAGREIHAPAYCAESFGQLDLLAVRFTEPGEAARAWLRWAVNFAGARSIAPTHTYRDGDVFSSGELTLQAIHAPGHTADHMVLWEPEHRVLLSFDVDLTSFGPWYGQPESDITAFKRTIRRLMDLRPRVIVSSHKGIVRHNVQARLQAFLDAFEARDRALRGLLAAPRTLDELVAESPIYHGYPPGLEVVFRFFERTMIAKHLDDLAVQGQVECEGAKFVRVGAP